MHNLVQQRHYVHREFVQVLALALNGVRVRKNDNGIDANFHNMSKFSRLRVHNVQAL